MELGFWSLDSVYQYLKKYSDLKLKHLTFDKIYHELWIGWIIGKYAESRSKNKYLLGLPFVDASKPIDLESLAKCKQIVQNIEFDVALIREGHIPIPGSNCNPPLIKIQIKREEMLFLVEI